ncbi:Hypothetical_protein [Hexamita inflata]|uniref:Hypothetical_protein n=1 Tax=Hexamita inflata TaxID=28002 RepID=A0AA86PJE8_9EUKA|nr:Hypothetical protein HINF_LOCUS27161 [Hexamita inflata]
MSLLVNCLGYRKVKWSISIVPNLKTIRQFNPKLRREIAFSIHSPNVLMSLHIYLYILTAMAITFVIANNQWTHVAEFFNQFLCVTITWAMVKHQVEQLSNLQLQYANMC